MNFTKLACLMLLSVLGFSAIANGQDVAKSYGNNAVSIHWLQRKTTHFSFVYPAYESSLIKKVVPIAERTYHQYHSMLGIAPDHKIRLYINDEDEVFSAARSPNVHSYESIWKTNTYLANRAAGMKNLVNSVRYEIAYDFQQAATSSKLGKLQYVLLSWPDELPWSAGLSAYLLIPRVNYFDRQWMRNYWMTRDGSNKDQVYWSTQFANMMKGRSQIHFFNQRISSHSFRSLYNIRQSVFGIGYFDFDKAFQTVSGQTYPFFKTIWNERERQRYRSERAGITEHAQGHPYRVAQLQKGVRDYLDVKADSSGRRVATITLPSSGRLLQTLSLYQKKQGEKGHIKAIDTGYFYPGIAWRSSDGSFVYAKQVYGKKGNYHYELFISNAPKHEKRQLTMDRHAVLPAFSNGGKQLAFVSRKQGVNTLCLMNMADYSIKDIRVFKQKTLQHISWQPAKARLLVSFNKKDGTCGAGIYNIKKNTFSVLPVTTTVPLHASWDQNGHAIYFTGLYHDVPNVFRGQYSHGTMTDIRPVTDLFDGARLWDVMADSSGTTQILANTLKSYDRSAVRIFPGRPIAKKIKPSGTLPAANPGYSSSNAFAPSSNLRASPPEPYHSSAHINLDEAIFVPYYLDKGNFGAAGYLHWMEPMHKHKIVLGGIYSFAQPFKKSALYASYTNNMFKPKIQLNYLHLPSSTDWPAAVLKERSLDVESISSLWRINALSNDYSDWYAGVMLRHMSLNYFSDKTLQAHHPAIVYRNKRDRQTDVKLTLTWRTLKPYRHTLIHPLDGKGVKLEFSGSDKALGSETGYGRLNVMAYYILPSYHKQRIYLYAHGVIQTGEPIGRDYLAFSPSGGYRLPDPNFMPDFKPGVEAAIRGYKTTVLGSRFLTGRMEYRIPLQLDSRKKLLGFIPPARTALALFADAGVLGGARTHKRTKFDDYRYSVGTEIKRVFSFGHDFQFTYELGVAQPLTKSFGPSFYVAIRSAIPF